MAKKMPKLDIENGVYPDRFPGDDLPENIQIHVADIAAEQGLDRELLSKYVILGGNQYWMASHYKTGIYFTKNANDPKVQDWSKGTPKARGFLKFVKEGGNSLGRPRGSRNRISAQQALENLGANPLEFLAGVMKGDIATLKKYNIRNPKEITIAQKIKCAENLASRVSPTLKAVDVDAEGNPVVTKDVEEQNKPQIQVYIPGTQSQGISFDASEEDVQEIEEKGVEQYLKEHESETLAYDTENADDSLVWSVDKDSK